MNAVSEVSATPPASPVPGRIWRFGDNVDTDAMAPGLYMKAGIDELARHCLENLRPEFPRDVRRGDIVVGGSNFGVGSSREQAPQALRHLGVAAVLAPSFAGLFYRNAINLGLPVLVCAGADALADGATAAFDLDGACLRLDDGSSIACEPVPDFLRALLHAGGLVPHLKARLSAPSGPA
ncbi:LeuD/DmdB family oxidoreductase small subunit [Cupriavidus agavae]|uniref:3-isopropylmalate dehydratase small subunit n=1 Tax=Cupriavidus agavae TaxID=1001822 RepID=A0A4Q7RFA3_9BURK|nr:3-isopropylmalate dehydratase [Cupriavidus agavae]RZT31861.1 3-isopropylmalate/(R)-2-methylmalate dehydratase small subunit [Cupriavidus agavae]